VNPLPTLSLPLFDDPPIERGAGLGVLHARGMAGPDEPAAAPFFMPSPEALHPGLWRASQLGSACTAVTPSGFAELDAALPGGGWPHRVLTELLLPHPGLGEMRLLAPALAALATASGGDAPARHSVMLFEPPGALCGWALAQIGIDAGHWLVVRGRDVLWALEQALKSGHLGAALAWLPAGLKADALRRLQLAAQVHDGPVFVFREVRAHSKPSVAPLRLLLAPAGIDALSVHLLKRRGPPLAEPLRLPLPPVLSERQRERAEAVAATEPTTLRPALARRW
jgi:protein ImuA